MYTDRFGRISRLRSGERNFRSRCGGYGHRQPVRRAQHAAAAGAIQHVRVDHRRRHIRVTEQLLDRPDVVPVLEKVRREGVPERVASHSLRRAARQRRRSNRTLQTLLVHVMPSPNSAPRIDRQLPGRKQPLPRPLASRIRVLPRKCVWQPDSRHTIRAVFLREPRSRSRCAASRPSIDSGSVVTRSFPPFPSRTRISRRFRSTSLTLNRRHSICRRPDPYSIIPIRRQVPSRRARIRVTSSRVRTTGRRRGLRARMTSPRKCLFHDAPHDPSVRRCGQGLSQAWNRTSASNARIRAERVTAWCSLRHGAR
jgi:hypothetical protein